MTVKRNYAGKDVNSDLERGKANKAKNFSQEVMKKSQQMKGTERATHHPKHPSNR